MFSEAFLDAAWAPRRPTLDWLRSLIPTVRSGTAVTNERDPTRLVLATATEVVDAVRELLGVELHDEQIMAGIAMCAGWGVQMRTGEGKTFAAILPTVVFGRFHHGVHVMTANDYLARRDAAWVGAVVRALGLTVGVTAPGMSRADVRAAYAADVIYGAERDFGFDFLRDGLWLPGDDPVQRGRCVAIVDEADAVLIDQARTPLVLSAPAPAAYDVIRRAAEIVATLDASHVELDARTRSVQLTDEGITACEHALGVADLFTDAVDWPHRLDMALRAQYLLARDHDYVVHAGRVSVVDELTGRTVAGRQWGDGLHQAVEAKESVGLSDERRDVARMSIGSYISGYRRVVGMSGTLEGAEDELADTVAMPVIAIPTHRAVIRVDEPDVAYADRAAKHVAVADDVASRHAAGQPVLVGTRSIDESRRFSDALRVRGIAHTVLSAEHPETEAAIVARAGERGAVTVATQMAGRGVDITLGDGVDGLTVWGLGHHPSRRLDDQLRGRAGRQGDAGSTRFAVAPDDDVPADEQGAIERFETDSRADARRWGAAYDYTQTKVSQWRQHARSGDLAALVDDALDAELDPRLRRRKRRDAIARARAELVVDEPIARRALDQLLIHRWADFLESLGALERFSHLGLGLTGDVRRWEARVAEQFADFLRRTKVEWLAHLRSLRIVHGAPPPADRLRVDAREEAAPEDIDTNYMPNYDTVGLKAANWLRRKYGVINEWEPPIVLNLEALGDTAPDADVAVRLDLANPANSVAYLGSS